MDEIKGKIALVTGANRGIGFETCRQLARLGLLVITSGRDAAKGKQAAERLRNEGGRIEFRPLDVTDPDGVEELHDWIAEKYGRLDVLVNNAGVFQEEDKSVLRVPLDVVRATMEINFYGALYLCQAFVPMMKQRGYGRVVNVSSEMGSLEEMGGYNVGYRASKAALNVLTRVVANEVRGQNIKVNSASPGWVRSDMGGTHAPRSLEQGAATVVWLATLPDDGPSGGFYRDQKVVPW